MSFHSALSSLVCLGRIWNLVSAASRGGPWKAAGPELQNDICLGRTREPGALCLLPSLERKLGPFGTSAPDRQL